MRQQVFQPVRFRAKNYDSDASSSQVLLVFDALVHGEENVKFGGFRCRKKFAVLETCESSVTRGLAIVVREIIPESLINTFIEQNSHLGAGEQEVLRFFEGGDG